MWHFCEYLESALYIRISRNFFCVSGICVGLEIWVVIQKFRNSPWTISARLLFHKKYQKPDGISENSKILELRRGRLISDNKLTSECLPHIWNPEIIPKILMKPIRYQRSRAWKRRADLWWRHEDILPHTLYPEMNPKKPDEICKISKF